MEGIKINRRVSLKEPVMLAAWPGMANAALSAIDYLRRKLGATPFGEIDAGTFYAPEAVVIDNGIARLPDQNRSRFYFTRNPDMIILESEFQLRDRPALELISWILDMAEKFKVKRIYTGAAFPTTMSYRDPSKVFAVVNECLAENSFSEFGIKMMKKGQISGLNGLLLGYAEERKIEAACLLATLPSYAVNFPNPKASRVIIETLGKMLSIQVDMQELNSALEELEEKMVLIEEKIKELFPTMVKEQEDLVNLEEEKVPDYVMEKIGKLFQEAQSDRSKAYLLKEELDRWDLYKLYEDKFLDLFKENQ